jgi:hypothetical protein
LLEEDGGEDIDAAVVLLLAKVWLVLHKNKREKTQMYVMLLTITHNITIYGHKTNQEIFKD